MLQRGAHYWKHEWVTWVEVDLLYQAQCMFLKQHMQGEISSNRLDGYIYTDMYNEVRPALIYQRSTHLLNSNRNNEKTPQLFYYCDCYTTHE